MVAYVVGNFRTGDFGGNADLDPGPGVISFYAKDDSSYVLKLLPGGPLAWVRVFLGGGNGTRNAYAITTDGDSNLYMVGSFDDKIDFDGVTLEADGLAFYLVKLNWQGSGLWARQLGGKPFDIDVNDRGDIGIVGDFWGTTDLDPGPGQHYVSTAGGYDRDCFLVTFDREGNFLAGTGFGGASNDRLHAVEIDGIGDLYAAGDFSETIHFDEGLPPLISMGGTDAFVTKFDPAHGLMWAAALQGPSDESALALSLGRNGHVYTVGSFAGTVDFDPQPGSANLTSHGGSDGYISKLDSNGHYVWAGQLGDVVRGISISQEGVIDVAGSFTESTDVDPGPGEFVLDSAGGSAGFLATLWQCTAEVADDGLDQDCNGTDTVTCHVDADGDGHGGLETSLADDGSCDAEQHERDLGDDCDDADATIHPGAVETCNRNDDDCDVVVDEGFDQDGDGYSLCALPVADCDDVSPAIKPGAVELPGNTVDEDCDGSLGVCDPTATWKNHGEFVRCVADECEQLVAAGALTQTQCDLLVGQVGRSSVGKEVTVRQRGSGGPAQY